MSVTADYGTLIALKKDGTIWRWSQSDRIWLTLAPPVRVGNHNDWIAIANGWDGGTHLQPMETSGSGGIHSWETMGTAQSSRFFRPRRDARTRWRI